MQAADAEAAFESAEVIAWFHNEQLLRDAIARARRKRRFKRDDDLMDLSDSILDQLASA